MVPLHFPFVVVRVLPTSGVPETSGGSVFAGATEPRFVAAIAGAARIASASALTAAIARGLAIAACRNRGCQGKRSMVFLLLVAITCTSPLVALRGPALKTFPLMCYK